LADGDIEVVRESVTLEHLSAMADAGFGDLVKAVIDVDTGVMAIGGTMHADEEAVLLDLGSRPANLWGINLYPGDHGSAGWIEFDSMINLRPSQGNRSRSVDDPETQARIRRIVEERVRRG
jgi:hypothetical protein